jgi:hypothetical protein
MPLMLSRSSEKRCGSSSSSMMMSGVHLSLIKSSIRREGQSAA